MDALQCIKTRRSVRRFVKEPIPNEILLDIADCGRLAATAINIQPVHIVIVTDEQLKAEIAKSTDYGQYLEEAPACMVVLSEDVRFYLEDGSAATQNILLAAKAHGLGSCWIAGNKKDYESVICRKLGAPTNYKLISIVALGKPESIPNIDKKPLESVVHWNRF